MANVYSDIYWTDEFDITIADLDRIAAHIRETAQAHDLTTLARRVVRGRLRFGPETSAPARPAWAEDPSVRLWNPAAEWKEGDQVIVAVGFPKSRRRTLHKPFVGEVIGVKRGNVEVRIDTLGESRTYSTLAKDEYELSKWRQFVEDLVAARRDTKDVETQVEYVILEHGERVVSQLLDALRADERFVCLAGHWFLRELAVSPTEEQLTTLAWAMVSLEEPQSTAELVPRVEPPLAESDPGLFGLYLAMRDRPDLFENADPGQRPRWVLAGQPPGSCIPQYAAYDPETYEILCLPGKSAPPETVKRLWNLGLLKAVL